MSQRLFITSGILLHAFLSVNLHGQSKPVVVTSPDGRLRAELSAPGGVLSYQIFASGQQVLAPSKLGVESDDLELGQDVALGTPTTHKVDERYRFFGARAIAHNDAREAEVPARSHGESYLVEMHVANDGVAVRLKLPSKPGRHIQADRSTWKLAGDPTLWTDKLDAAYESPYHERSLKQLGDEELGLPLTAHMSGDLYVTLTEAALKDYGDLAVKPSADGSLSGDLYADPQGWRTDDAVVQPWRVAIVARDLTALVNSTLVQDLNPPPDPLLLHAEWIQPGRSSWQWLAIGDPRQEDQKQWVDWTSQLGFEYYLIDEGWSRWKEPWAALAETTAYAKPKKVKIWIWVHSRLVRSPDARREFFRKAAEAGVVGVKIDFPPACSRDVSNWYFETARDAAAAHLMVDFHGANKPTGMERTWPNVLTREGVRGHEYHITRYHRVLEADHDVILPFTRYVAGPGDYTPTVFKATELVGNTWAHELAQSVIFTSPFLCFGGHPETYLSNPARDVLSSIPATWDETVVLPGSLPGKVVAEARRSGADWFIAVINGAEPSSLEIPLSFLRKGVWKAITLRDSTERPDAFLREEKSLARTSHIQLKLAARGGFVARLEP